MSLNLSDIAILNIKGSDYRCIISGINKSKTMNLKSRLKKQNIIKHKNLLPHIKIGKEILTFGDIKLKKKKTFRHESLTF